MKYKLLVAEDAPLERKLLCETLNTHLGSRITLCEAKNGTEALALFASEQPQIAVLDIEMPGISGLDVAKAIRRSSKGCSIILLTGSDNVADAREAISLRALDYLVKPYDEKKLLASVEDGLQIAAHLSDNLRELPVRLPSRISAEDPEATRITLVREDISNYIDTHYMEELSMKNVAHAMNYSDAYFCKLFKQCFHVNFSAYLNEYRISKAKAMMDNPRINVKDISTACGYTDSNYFARVFKRITGQTPSEYRLAVIEKALQDP